MSKRIAWAAFAAFALVLAIIQFIPAKPVVIPARQPVADRAEHRRLAFEGITNFRDLGGYPTADGRRVKWGTLYRSAALATASDSDLGYLRELALSRLIDFRSRLEQEREPNRLPDPRGFEVVAIPAMDDNGHSPAEEFMARLESGNLEDFDPHQFMLEVNRQYVDRFTPQFSQFMHTVLAAGGKPVLWHCSAGKDRTGFATAILLRILGVPLDAVMEDYMLSESGMLTFRETELLWLRLTEGEEAYEKLRVIMGVDASWLQAALDEIEIKWQDFDSYVSAGLKLTAADLLQLRNTLLE